MGYEFMSKGEVTFKMGNEWELYFNEKKKC